MVIAIRCTWLLRFVERKKITNCLKWFSHRYTTDILKSRPCFAGRGFLLNFPLSVCVCLCVCVCGQDISKSIQPINFIIGGSLPCDPGKKPLDFEKNRQGVRVGLGGGGGSNDKRWEKKFRVAITPKRCKFDMYLLLDTKRKSCMGSPTAPLDFTLSDLERSKSRSPRFWSLISRKGA